MKWNKKGHQFDKIGEKLKAHKGDIYIYGAGEYGAELFNRIKFLDTKIIFVDGNIFKKNEKYMGVDVISPHELITIKEEHIVIVAASILNTEIILKQLLCNGYLEGENLFTYKRFCEFYLPIYATYVESKTYIQDITILITEKCSLKCKKCAPMYPYLKMPKNRMIVDIIADIDSLFEHVDYVWDLIFTGGEPFLHAEFYEVLNYVKYKYSNKYEHIQIISNGTIIPTPKICELMSDMNLYITVSNYTNSIPKIKERYEEFIARLDYYQVNYIPLEVDRWVDFGFDENNMNNESSEQMINMFDSCNSSCRAFVEQHFVYCVPAYYSQIVLENKGKDVNNNFISNNKKEILEYSMGYCDDGYLKMCKKCNGYITINRKYVQVAEQLKGI